MSFWSSHVGSWKRLVAWLAAFAVLYAFCLFALYREHLGRLYLGVDMVTVAGVHYTGSSRDNASIRNMTRVFSDAGEAWMLCGDETSKFKVGAIYRVETRLKEFTQDNHFSRCQDLLSGELVPTGFDLEVHSGKIVRIDHEQTLLDRIYPYGISVTLEETGQQEQLRVCNDGAIRTLRDLRNHQVDLVLDKTAYSVTHDCYPLIAFRRDRDPHRYVLDVGLILAPAFARSGDDASRTLQFIDESLDRLFPAAAKVGPSKDASTGKRVCTSPVQPISVVLHQNQIAVMVAGPSCEGEASNEITVVPDPATGKGICTLDVGGTIDSLKKVRHQGEEAVLVNTFYRMYATEYLVHWSGDKVVARVRLEGDAAYETLEEFTCVASGVGQAGSDKSHSH